MILRKSTVAYLCTPQLTYARKALGAVAETQQEVILALFFMLF